MKRKAQDKQRKIEPSFAGRLKFLPGDDHPLDVMITEAQQLWKQVGDGLGKAVEQLERLDRMGDPTAALEGEDQALQQVIRGRYRDHKHRDHILAVFMSLYRRRLLARLAAAQEALALAEELLSPDDALRQSLQQALGIDPMEADIGRADLVGNAHTVKARLSRSDERLQTIRRGLTLGNGWLERFFVTRTRLKPEFLRKSRRDRPGQEGEDPFETVTYGPYLKYRWRDGAGPKYTISMGLIPDAPSDDAWPGGGPGQADEN